MDIRLLAGIGFVIEVVSALFIFLVLVRQWRLFKYRVQPDLVVYRKILFMIALIIFSGSIVPMLIDLFTVLDVVQRTTNHLNPIGVIYFISNTMKSFLLSLLIWFLYRMAARTLLITEQEKRDALEVKNKPSAEV